MSTTYEFRLIRAERLQLAAAALRGILSGAIRAVVFLAPGSAPPPAPVMGSSLSRRSPQEGSLSIKPSVTVQESID